MQGDFEYITALQYRCRYLSQLVEEFKSGEKYRKMEQE